MVSRPLANFTYSAWMSVRWRAVTGGGRRGRCVAPTASPTSAAASLFMCPPVRVHAQQRGFAGRHLVAAAQGVLGGPLHLRRDIRLDVRESRRGDAPLLQVFLIQAYRIALPPALEELIGQQVARLALVMGGVPAHPKRLRDQQRRPLTATTALGRESGRRVGVEHVVAVELGAT